MCKVPHRDENEKKEDEPTGMNHAPPESTMLPAGAEPSRCEVWRMFDRIAHRYDLLNRLLSFGLDVRWRNRMAGFLAARGNQHLLDLATGTADQLLALMDRSGCISRATGMDMAEAMLERGREKVKRRGLDPVVRLETGDAVHIPSPDDAFDVVTISFGIRNVEDVGGSLKEMHRVLKPGGRALILEFSMPANRCVRTGHLFYLRHILPRIGGMVSGDFEAYRYLNRTIESFPYGREFCALMETAGFRETKAHAQTFGVATIYQGDKATESNALGHPDA
jgi:demethylmenaquinone methyltransferase/2-methoxy-6-polyprenyl-1,4-benzoquinol methylase